MAKSAGGEIPEASREGLLEEVANLVESPTPVLGSFDPDFLSLPREVLVMVMKKHQRYFPVEDPATGELLPKFVTVANGDIDPDAVRVGNEGVLTARYQDARFFYNQDIQTPLEELRPLLAGITFETTLGNMLEKADRVTSLVAPLGAATGASAAVLATATTAARIARADLSSSVVMEFTSLAGTMGEHYAVQEGLPEDVARAIFEAALPRSSGDILPTSEAGILVALADRLDSLVGLFAVGCAPSASADPFGLRRTAYGLVQTLVTSGLDLNLTDAIAAAAAVQPVEVKPEVLREAQAFVERRLEQLLVDGGAGVEVVRAVLKQQGSAPALAARAVGELQAEVATGGERLASVLTAYARPTRIGRGKEGAGDAADLREDIMGEEEAALFKAYQEVAAAVRAGVGVDEFLNVSQVLVAPTEAFFDKVFVMDEDMDLRKNRLTLLKCVAELPDGILDLSELPGF
ncbi:hypothetical protein CYMTET_20708 [Cymbomonas tetramitiformis]|uniref:glycine--tRNA ligase n=1 Tax=Cymbomonas tetramitiformis TaxID=36881 RepID=A0AAE0G480_9CHLO|nr:hypothetical protein CYMTET_20708 [Cymbomonas tetramitiformis]